MDENYTNGTKFVMGTSKNPHETLCSDGTKYDSFGVPIVSNCVEKVVFRGALISIPLDSKNNE